VPPIRCRLVVDAGPAASCGVRGLTSESAILADTGRPRHELGPSNRWRLHQIYTYQGPNYSYHMIYERTELEALQKGQLRETAGV